MTRRKLTAASPWYIAPDSCLLFNTFFARNDSRIGVLSGPTVLKVRTMRIDCRLHGFALKEAGRARSCFLAVCTILIIGRGGSPVPAPGTYYVLTSDSAVRRENFLEKSSPSILMREAAFRPGILYSVTSNYFVCFITLPTPLSKALNLARTLIGEWVACGEVSMHPTETIQQNQGSILFSSVEYCHGS